MQVQVSKKAKHSKAKEPNLYRDSARTIENSKEGTSVRSRRFKPIALINENIFLDFAGDKSHSQEYEGGIDRVRFRVMDNVGCYIDYEVKILFFTRR